MIRNFEKNILEKILFTEQYLKRRKKYVNNGLETPTIKKQEIIKIFQTLGYNCQYVVGGAYNIKKEYKDFVFELSFHISKNSPLVYIYVQRNNILLNTGLSHFSYMLNFLNYDENLINRNFGINSVNDLENYIKDMIELFDEFVDEYCKEIDVGNVFE